MNNWIKINLPYSVHEYFGGVDLEYPNLEKRAKKELGFGYKDVDKLQKQVFSDRIGHDTGSTIMYKIDNELYQKYDADSVELQTARVAKFLKSKNKNVQLTGAWLNKKYQYDQWMNNQPEVIGYHQEFKKKKDLFDKELAKKSFSGLDLDKPGTLIEVEFEGKINQYLIGHINPLAGVCDDCCGFDKTTTIVKRYKIVWSGNDK